MSSRSSKVPKKPGPGKSPKNPETAFSKVLKYYRTEIEITQEDLEEYSGVPKKRISAIESGESRKPHADTIKKIVLGLQQAGLDIDTESFYTKVAEYNQPAPTKPPYTEHTYTNEESRGKEDLASVLQHLQTARHFVSELGKQTNSEQRFIQTATTIFDFIEILAKEPFRLDDFCNVMRQFDCLSQEANRRNLNRLGSLMSLQELREKLRGFEEKVTHLHNSPDGLVPNGWPTEEVKHQQLVRELEFEIEDRIKKLEVLPDPDLRQSALKTLMSLKIELGLNPLNLREVNAIRQRLEQLDRDVFQDMMKKCQLILGQHAEYLPAGMVFRDWENAPEMVVIPAGVFIMGTSEEDNPDEDYKEYPQHEVVIPCPFAVGRYPVTFEEWDYSFENKGVPLDPEDESWGRGTRPVIKISWDDILYYSAWLSGRTAREYRLLSEAEWEYACRAGSDTQYHFGDDEAQLEEYAWYDKNADGKTQPVGQKKPNQFGLYDMHGNVWEWCEDHWHEDYTGAPADGSAWIDDNDEKTRQRVLRGGSWGFDPLGLRARYRDWDRRDYRSRYNGFRVARALTPR